MLPWSGSKEVDSKAELDTIGQSISTARDHGKVDFSWIESGNAEDQFGVVFIYFHCDFIGRCVSLYWIPCRRALQPPIYFGPRTSCTALSTSA